MSGLVLLNTVVLVLFLYLLPSSNLRSMSLKHLLFVVIVVVTEGKLQSYLRKEIS